MLWGRPGAEGRPPSSLEAQPFQAHLGWADFSAVGDHKISMEIKPEHQGRGECFDVNVAAARTDVGMSGARTHPPPPCG